MKLKKEKMEFKILKNSYLIIEIRSIGSVLKATNFKVAVSFISILPFTIFA